MKLTKYEHSCMVLEDKDQQLIIDPGTFSPSLPELTKVVGVVVTHQHPDHLSADNLASILQANPEVSLYAPQDVLDELDSLEAKKVVADLKDPLKIGSFWVEFVGGKHAPIYQKSPCENVGVIVNETFYYPGDSLDRPSENITTLAVPASAPWLKVSEAMDFIAKIKPTVVFPAHDMLLSEIGKSVHYRWLQQAAEATNAQWRVLQVGQSLDI